MRSIEEGHLRFEFDSTWDHIEKWDDSRCFKNGISCVAEIDALDIVAFSQERKECLLLEIKDFRDQNEQPHDRASRKPEPTEAQVARQLTEKAAQKLAGTIAGLVGAARMQDEAFAQDLAKALADHRSAGFTVRVVLWVEGEPTSKGKSPRSKVNLGTLTQQLKRQVTWLPKHPVQVLSSASPPTIPGLSVTDSRP
jgi:hypothetical protein